MIISNYIKLLTILVLFIFALYSCEDVVEVELNAENLDLISVEAYINTNAGNNVFVKLEKTLPVDETNVNPPVNGAIVEISDDEAIPNTITLEEAGETGIYKLPSGAYYPAIPGRTYTLNIITSEGINITASDYLQKVETIDDIKVNLSARGDFEFMAIFISSQETQGPGHFYKWDVYINNQLLYESENLSFANDDLVDGNYIHDLEIFTDFYEEEEDRIINMGDSIYVEQLSISSSAYDFYTGMINQAFSGSPFSVPPANIPNNLISSDGKKVLGIFSARDISRSSMVVVDSTNFNPLYYKMEGL